MLKYITMIYLKIRNINNIKLKIYLLFPRRYEHKKYLVFKESSNFWRADLSNRPKTEINHI